MTYLIGYQVLAQVDRAGEVLTFHHLMPDGSGHTRFVTNESGLFVPASRYAYDAYGNPIGFDPATALTSILYRGQYYDAATGQYFMRARYYNPATGGFTSFDAFEGYLAQPGTLNKYAYAGASPVMYWDPSGLFAAGTFSGLLASGTDVVGAQIGIAAGGTTIRAGLALILAGNPAGLQMVWAGTLEVAQAVIEYYLDRGSDSKGRKRKKREPDKKGDDGDGGSPTPGKPGKGGDGDGGGGSPSPRNGGPKSPGPSGDAPNKLSPRNYPIPDPPMNAPPVRHNPQNIDEVMRMRQGKSPIPKKKGGEWIEGHHRQQVPTKNGGVIDEVYNNPHRGPGNHSRHNRPSQLTPSQRSRELREHYKRRGAEYMTGSGEGI